MINSIVRFVIIISSCAVSVIANEKPGKDKDVVNLWPESVPLQQENYSPEVWGKWGLIDIHTPTLTIYPAAKKVANGMAVLIIPGGGYEMVCINHEGHRVAEWFNKQGVSAFVLKYRVKPYAHPVPLMDAQRAIRYIRFNADKFCIDPETVGVLGFSAGGHLASSLCVHYNMKTRELEDEVDALSARPDFSVLVYPVISLEKGETYWGCRRYLIGVEAEQKMIDLMSTHKQVGPQTPPAFLVHGTLDTAVIPKNSELYLAALKQHGIPGELFMVSDKGHGFGLGGGWSQACYQWIQRTMSEERK